MKYSSSAIVNRNVTWTFLSPNEELPDLHIKIANTNMVRRHFMLLHTLLAYSVSKGEDAPVTIHPLHLPVDICKYGKLDKLSGQSVNVRIGDGVVTLQVPHVDFSHNIKLDDFIQMVHTIMHQTLNISPESVKTLYYSENDNTGDVLRQWFAGETTGSGVQSDSDEVTSVIPTTSLTRKKNIITISLAMLDVKYPIISVNRVSVNHNTNESAIKLILDDDNVFKPGRTA